MPSRRNPRALTSLAVGLLEKLEADAPRLAAEVEHRCDLTVPLARLVAAGYVPTLTAESRRDVDSLIDDLVEIRAAIAEGDVESTMPASDVWALIARRRRERASTAAV